MSELKTLTDGGDLLYEGGELKTECCCDCCLLFETRSYKVTVNWLSGLIGECSAMGGFTVDLTWNSAGYLEGSHTRPCGVTWEFRFCCTEIGTAGPVAGPPYTSDYLLGVKVTGCLVSGPNSVECNAGNQKFDPSNPDYLHICEELRLRAVIGFDVGPCSCCSLSSNISQVFEIIFEIV